MTVDLFDDEMFEPEPPLARRRLSNPPSAAAPSVLPRLRENTFEAVAEPRSRQPTLSCTMTMAAVLRKPMPKPMMSEPRPATYGDIAGVRKTNGTPPSAISAPPAIRIGRSPKRWNWRAPAVAAIGQPRTIAVSMNPATSGERPITT